jgi:hypothetical protein
MRNLMTFRGRLVLCAVLAASAACGGATDANSSEPRVSQMRLQIGGHQVVVTGTGAVIGEAVVMRVGTPTAISAVFTDEFGVPIPSVVSGDFRLDVEMLESGIATYTPSVTNTLSGSLLPTRAATGTSIRFTLYHVTKGHIEWGPFVIEATLAV